MERHGSEGQNTSNEVRNGSTLHAARHVLLVSLAVTAVALLAIWITGSLTLPDKTSAKMEADGSKVATITENR